MNGNANTTFVLIELVAVIIFTIEYLSRLLTVSAYPTVPELTDVSAKRPSWRADGTRPPSRR